MARLYLRFRRFVGQLQRDAATAGYTDVALTPDSETDMNTLEILTQIAVVR